MQYTKTLPLTGAALLGAAGYWGLLVLFVSVTVVAALLHHHFGRIK